MATPRIFNASRRRKQTQALISMSSEDFCQLFKLQVYLQDAIKIILDKREQKPHQVLQQQQHFLSFSLVVKGQHVLLRDFAFVNSSHYNRACYLKQIDKIFLSSPYYQIITALDYHQCLCLVCSDFPRTLVAQASKILPISSPQTLNPTLQQHFISTLVPQPVLFQKFQIRDLKDTVEIHLYHSQFLQKVKELFGQLGSSGFDIEAQVMVSLLYTGFTSIYTRFKQTLFIFPPIEHVVEALMTKAQSRLRLDPQQLLLIQEVGSIIHGAGSISYREFVFNLMKNQGLKSSMFSMLEIPISHQQQLKELSVDDPVPEDTYETPKRTKSKKKRPQITVKTQYSPK